MFQRLDISDTVLMPMDADAIETAHLAWFCAAVFLWELIEQSANHPGPATTISEELQAFKNHMMQNARLRGRNDRTERA